LLFLFYIRWGDAPVHSIAAALMLKKDEVHWFYDHGYFHNPFGQCPREPEWVANEKCLCDPNNEERAFGKFLPGHWPRRLCCAVPRAEIIVNYYETLS
jgi:hypothetical protein